MTTLAGRADPWLIEEADYPRDGTLESRLRFLVGYAVLSPSVFNTQPWAFSLRDNGIALFADPARAVRCADTDLRDFHVSLGCVLETLVVAAAHFGLRPRPILFPESYNRTLIALVEMDPSSASLAASHHPLFGQIRKRRTHHGEYSPEPAPHYEEEILRASGEGEGVKLLLTHDRDLRARADALLVEADARQLADPEFRRQLQYRLEQGTFGAEWILAKLSRLAAAYLQAKSNAGAPDADVLKNAPLFGIYHTPEDTPEWQVKAGRCLQRTLLTASALGLYGEPLTHVLQVRATRAEVAAMLAEPGRAPQATVRLGYAAAPRFHTARRDPGETII